MTATALAAELGIRGEALSRWKRELEEEHVVAFPNQGILGTNNLRGFVRRMPILRMERDILKKAMAIFSRAESKIYYLKKNKC